MKKRNIILLGLLVLATGMVLTSCAGLMAASPTSTASTPQDVKGGRISIRSQVDYWITQPVTIDYPRHTIDGTLNSGVDKGGGIGYPVREDGQYEIYYKRRSSGETLADTLKWAKNEDWRHWPRKTVYVSNGERVEVTIP